jgi:transposase InsO family protein
MRHRLRIVRDYHARRRAGAREYDAAPQAAQRAGCSDRSVRRYACALRTGGKRALLPRYHVPAPAPPSIGFYAASVVLALRAHLGWCGQRIAAELSRRGIAETSHTSVYRLLRRYHAAVRTYHPVGRRDGIRYRKQRVRAPNWTWHIDFAGPLTGPDGANRSLLLVVDSYSRMLLALEVVDDQKAATAERVLAGLFERYGTPRVLISDNGRAFAPAQTGQQHRFERFLAGHGVEHRRTKPYYPQTNGKAEAMVKTVKREFLGVLARISPDRRWHWDEVEAQVAAFEGWYNFYRAHGALGYAVPAPQTGQAFSLRRDLAAEAGSVLGVWSWRSRGGGRRVVTASDYKEDAHGTAGSRSNLSILPSYPLHHRLIQIFWKALNRRPGLDPGPRTLNELSYLTKVRACDRLLDPGSGAGTT